MNMESVLERLREADPHPDGLPAPPIEPVLQRLGQDPGVTVRPPRRSRIGTMAGAAAALAVVVAVAAAIGLTGQRPSRPASGRGGANPTAPYGATAVAGQFSILRHFRPGTPILVAVARAAGLRPGGHLTVVRQLPAVHPRPGVTDHLLVVLIRRHGHARLSLVTVQIRGASTWSMTSTYVPGDPIPSVGLGVVASLIPDWVTRVTWSLARQRGGPLTTIHPRVVDNVAYAVVPSVAPGSLQASWSGHGRLVGASESPAIPECQARQLIVRLSSRSAGDAGLTLELRPPAPGPCQLLGSPRAILRGRGGTTEQLALRPAGSSSGSPLLQGSVQGVPGLHAVYALRPCRPLHPPLRLVVRLPNRGGVLSLPVAPGRGVACVIATRP